MIDSLSKSRRVELKAAFEMYNSKNKTGLLNFRQMSSLLRSIGVQLDCRDLLALQGEHRDRGDFSWEDLLLIGEQAYNDKVLERTLLAALHEVAGKQAKKISTKVLRNLLLALGVDITLSQEEVDMFLTVECDPDRTGSIDFETFIQRVLQR